MKFRTTTGNIVVVDIYDIKYVEYHVVIGEVEIVMKGEDCISFFIPADEIVATEILNVILNKMS